MDNPVQEYEFLDLSGLGEADLSELRTVLGSHGPTLPWSEDDYSVAPPVSQTSSCQGCPAQDGPCDWAASSDLSYAVAPLAPPPPPHAFLPPPFFGGGPPSCQWLQPMPAGEPVNGGGHLDIPSDIDVVGGDDPSQSPLEDVNQVTPPSMLPVSSMGVVVPTTGSSGPPAGRVYNQTGPMPTQQPDHNAMYSPGVYMNHPGIYPLYTTHPPVTNYQMMADVQTPPPQQSREQQSRGRGRKSVKSRESMGHSHGPDMMAHAMPMMDSYAAAPYYAAMHQTQYYTPNHMYVAPGFPVYCGYPPQIEFPPRPVTMSVKPDVPVPVAHQGAKPSYSAPAAVTQTVPAPVQVAVPRPVPIVPPIPTAVQAPEPPVPAQAPEPPVSAHEKTVDPVRAAPFVPALNASSKPVSSGPPSSASSSAPSAAGHPAPATVAHSASPASSAASHPVPSAATHSAPSAAPHPASSANAPAPAPGTAAAPAASSSAPTSATNAATSAPSTVASKPADKSVMKGPPSGAVVTRRPAATDAKKAVTPKPEVVEVDVRSSTQQQQQPAPQTSPLPASTVPQPADGMVKATATWAERLFSKETLAPSATLSYSPSTANAVNPAAPPSLGDGAPPGFHVKSGPQPVTPPSQSGWGQMRPPRAASQRPSRDYPAFPTGPAPALPLPNPADDPKLYKLSEFLHTYKLEHKAISLQPRGLTNRSNWCYINATLQALLACPPFYNLLRSLPFEPSNRGPTDSRTPIIDSMKNFVNEFMPLNTFSRTRRSDRAARSRDGDGSAAGGCDINTGLSFEPVYVHRMLSAMRSDTMVEGRQEDAEEFLSCLLNGLNDEMLELMKLTPDLPNGDVPAPNPAISANGESDAFSQGDDEEWKVMGPKNKGSITRRADFGRTPLSDIFRGHLLSRVFRQNVTDNVTVNVQPFFTLQLDIEKVTSVKKALEQYVQRDELEGVTCSRSNQEVQAWQEVQLEELPPVLLLHLKWFDYRQDGCSKICKSIQYEIDLKLDSKLLSSKKAKTASQLQYKLFAVVYHDGKEATKGHYITDAYHVGYGSWIRYDDQTVTVVSQAQVTGARGDRVPYLLYYRRVDTILGH